MLETPFYGRQEELSRLKDLLEKKSSSLIVIKGRRRIGKSRLIEEFSKNFRSLFFIGLPPDKKTTAQSQRDQFARQMKQQLGIESENTEDWSDLLLELSKETQDGRLILVFDEINWIGSLDHTFLGKLKSAWDQHFKKNPQLIMILSGSMSSWIDTNILSSTGFMGRFSLELTLDELPLPVCNRFWRNKPVSSYEKFKILSVTGGVPRYLEEINPNKSAKENILKLAFTKGGLLVLEFDRIFSDLFSKRSARYKQIVEILAHKNATLEHICTTLGLEKSGIVSDYLKDLIETGYVAKDSTWDIKTGKKSNLSEFRLKDNYLRFYLRYIEPQKEKIESKGSVQIPAWSTIMGLQFENLVLNNFHKTFELLCIDPHDVTYDNPFFQRHTQSQAGCQIDYLIQTRFNTLYVCEVKFSTKPIGAQVIKEVKEKIENLSHPKTFRLGPCSFTSMASLMQLSKVTSLATLLILASF